MSIFVEQYDRMQRWYKKFSDIDKGRSHDTPSENYVDDIYAFFQNAYHLKDWIKNDLAVPAHVQSAVEQHINNNRSLELCADICNSLKHLDLARPRSGEVPTFGKKVFGLNIGGGPTTISLKYEVVIKAGNIDAFGLASDCVKAWDAFRATHQI